MKKNDLGKIIREIAAIIPIYLPGRGIASQIHLKKGEVLLDKRDSKKIVADLAALLAVDLGGLKKFVRLKLNIRNTVPLPLNPELLFVPIRVRKPVVPRDCATGYFNYFCIEDVLEKDKFAQIILVDGKKIDTIQRERTIRNTILFANLAYREWQFNYVNPFVKGVGKELYKSAKLEMIKNIMEDDFRY
ncbi:hypothetical protein [Anaerobranca gottschalkii]|uniref:ComK protein n=1 Tax=Anaerobranca gottschalkii DSM 13577 TaxID=1120990 RepID=A0A1H9ZGT4_9FIRM|nr:hypothetical protein [Anaerobranca gottschalkii]SES80807.1 hypothetical protein SAMN03080614_100920 [Anaerobranca gottschalkii DSM 13577]